jgi:serine/threonine protein kinase
MARIRCRNQSQQHDPRHERFLGRSETYFVGTLEVIIIISHSFRSMPPHPNLVQTFGVSIDSNHPCIVLEFCDGGSLDKIVFNHRLNVDEQRALVKGVAFGLAHLHSHKIVHRDLAVRNILVRDSLTRENRC